jgi:AcrR family transcriptional regulator
LRKVQERRSADEARTLILETAERHLATGGPNAVRVQKIGAELGLTDAAVHYHFGNREKLMEALMRHAGRKLRDGLERAHASGDPKAELDNLLERLDETYRRKGYARLALWLALEGSEPARGAVFRDTAAAIHKGRTGATLEDTQLAVALLNVFLIGETFAGGPLLQGVGLEPNDRMRERLRRFTFDMVTKALGFVPAKPRKRPKRA